MTASSRVEDEVGDVAVGAALLEWGDDAAVVVDGGCAPKPIAVVRVLRFLIPGATALAKVVPAPAECCTGAGLGTTVDVSFVVIVDAVPNRSVVVAIVEEGMSVS